MSDGSGFTAITTSRGTLCESIRWIPARQSLQWVDILEGRLCRWQSATGQVEERQFEPPLACAVPVDGRRVILAFECELAMYDWDDASLRPFCELPVSPGTRLNDGGLAPDGSVWIGSMSPGGLEGRGRLWRVTLDGSIEVILPSVSISNGLGWLDRNRILYVDTPTGRVDLLQPDSDDGWMRSTFVQLNGAGSPDGLYCGADGQSWIAMWDGFRVIGIDREGVVKDSLRVPAPKCTSVTPAGARGDLVAVTTASWGMTPDELDSWPLSGHVLLGRFEVLRGQA